MSKAVFVTGNAHKAQYLRSIIGYKLPTQQVDVEEIQSLNLAEIVEHKARHAYDHVRQPVIVEDTQLIFHALGRLPGSYIKWFLDEIGAEGLCRLLKGFDDRSAIAGAAIAYYDGKKLQIFEKSLSGSIAHRPQGRSGFGWNNIFIPDGSHRTLGQMDDDEFKQWYVKIKPINELAEFLSQTAK